MDPVQLLQLNIDFQQLGVEAGSGAVIGGLIGFAGAPNPIPGVVGSHEVFHLASLAGVYCFWRFVQDISAATPIGRPGAAADLRAPKAARSAVLGEPAPESEAGP